MSKWVYLFFIVGGGICTALFAVIGSRPATQEMLYAVPIPAVLAAAFQLGFVYRMWDVIQTGGLARMTPGRAVGFLFIPIFNLYWIFQVFPGFATDYNATLRNQELGLPPLPRGLFVAYAVLVLVAVPVLNWVVQTLVILKVCKAATALRQAV